MLLLGAVFGRVAPQLHPLNRNLEFLNLIENGLNFFKFVIYYMDLNEI
jgi:hypothetical protein